MPEFRTDDGLTFWRSDDGVVWSRAKDNRFSAREAVISVDPRVFRATIRRIAERDADLLRRLAR